MEIGPDEENAVILFFALSTQWRREAMTGRRIGLDYGVVAPTATLYGLTMDPALFHDIRVMEIETLDRLATMQ